MKMSKKEKTVLTKTQKRSLFRWFLNGGASLNYERMMSMAYTYSMHPWLKENYDLDVIAVCANVGQDDDMSKIEEKAKEGLDVRLMYDDMGCISLLPYGYDKILEKKGIKCIHFLSNMIK